MHLYDLKGIYSIFAFYLMIAPSDLSRLIESLSNQLSDDVSIKKKNNLIFFMS